MMKVLDIFSWRPVNEISLKELEQIFMEHKAGISNDRYVVTDILPPNIPEYILECKNELMSDGKKVDFVLNENEIIAAIGYHD